MRKQKGIRVIMMLMVFAMAVLALQAKPAYAKVKLNKKTVYLAKGDSIQLKIKGTKKKVKWTSNKKSVATVTKKGKVKAKKIGTAKIIAKVGGKKYKCTVIVEKKSVNRARKLRNYVLSKGKYDKKEKTYTLEWVKDDGSFNFTNVWIVAYKDKKEMDFYYYQDQESGFQLTLCMKVDLISGNESVRTGDFEIDYLDDVDEIDRDIIYGTITTLYDGDEDAITLTQYKWRDSESEDYNYKSTADPADLETHYETANNRLRKAFARWDLMFSKKYKDLKKSGVSMKSIGFSKWIK